MINTFLFFHIFHISGMRTFAPGTLSSINPALVCSRGGALNHCFIIIEDKNRFFFSPCPLSCNKPHLSCKMKHLSDHRSGFLLLFLPVFLLVFTLRSPEDVTNMNGDVCRLTSLSITLMVKPIWWVHLLLTPPWDSRESPLQTVRPAPPPPACHPAGSQVNDFVFTIQQALW